MVLRKGVPTPVNTGGQVCESIGQNHFRQTAAPQRKKKRGRGQVRVHGPSSRSVASTRRGGAGSIPIYPIRSPSQMVPSKERENPRAGMELRGLSSASVTRHYFLIG